MSLFDAGCGADIYVSTLRGLLQTLYPEATHSGIDIAIAVAKVKRLSTVTLPLQVRLPSPSRHTLSR